MNNNSPETGRREEEKIQESGKDEEIIEDEESVEDLTEKRILQIEESVRGLKAEVWQGGTEDDVKFAQEIGFKVD